MRIARLSNPWLPIFLIALCVFVIYSNIYSSPFVFDDKHHIVEKENIGDLDYHMSFDRLRQPRGIVYLTFALNYRFGGLNVFGYHLVNVLIHFVNGILAYFLARLVFTRLLPLPASAPRHGTDVSPDTTKAATKKGADKKSRKRKAGKTQPPAKGPSNRPGSALPTRERSTPALPGQPFSIFNFQFSIPLMSLFAALIFVAHPIQTQAVTYTVQRIAAMGAMFFLASVLFYVKARLIAQSSKLKAQSLVSHPFSAFSFQLSALYVLSIICAILAFLSKQNTACLPLMILLLEYVLFERTWQRWRRKLIWLVPVSLLFGLFVLHTFGVLRGELEVATWLEDVSERMRETDIVGRWAYLCTQFNVIVLYVRLLFLPMGQNLDHMYPFKSGFFDGLTPLAFIFLIGMVALGIWNIKKRPIISLGIFWFFIALSVESSIIPIHDAMFEHRLYLPMFGFALVVPYLLLGLFSRGQSWAIVTALVLVMFLGTATYLRNRVWQGEVTLWGDVVSKNPQSDRGYVNLGGALGAQGKIEQAIAMFQKALKLRPDYGYAHYNLGNAFERQGKLDEAIRHYSEVVRSYPRDADAHESLAVVLVRKGKIGEAIRHYSVAVRLKSSSLGGGHQRKPPKGGIRVELALNNYCITSQFVIKPGDLEKRYNLAMAFEWQGKLEEAASHYAEVLRIKPDYAEAHNNLGVVLARLGRVKEAADHFSEALRIKPGYADAKKNLQRAQNLLSDPEG